jgi:antitoxin (DNA-binding transcriptional repressor) of toxin-antitoxin stability system
VKLANRSHTQRQRPRGKDPTLEAAQEVEAGERVIIARAGEPVAVLGPYKAAVRRRRLGLCAGQVTIREDFDELPPDIAEAFGMSQ